MITVKMNAVLEDCVVCSMVSAICGDVVVSESFGIAPLDPTGGVDVGKDRIRCQQPTGLNAYRGLPDRL